VTYHQLTFRKGTVLSARFAPDNRTVIYSAAWSGKDPELFSTRQDSIESRPVGLSQVDLLGISSKGEIAISLKPTALQGFFGTLGTLGRTPLTGGTAPREMLENVEWSDWSPDGSNLLVVRTVGNENRIEYPVGKVVYKVAVPASESRFVSIPNGAMIVAQSPSLILTEGARQNRLETSPACMDWPGHRRMTKFGSLRTPRSLPSPGA